MRKLGLLPLFLGLLLWVPEGQAATAQGDLASDAPVYLTGGALAQAAWLSLHHHAFRDGSLAGSVYRGQFYDDSTAHVPGGEPPPCYTYEGETAQNVIAAVDTGEGSRGVTFQLLEGALGRYVPASSLGFTGATPDAAAPDRSLGLMGPNPYRYQAQQLPRADEVVDVYAPAWPNATYLLAPVGAFSTTSAGRLEVHWGRLEIHGAPQATTHEAGVRRETRVQQLPGPLPAAVTCNLDVTHVLKVDVDLGFLTLDQDGLQRVAGYWAGEAQEEAFAADEVPPPAGYWDRRRGADYAAALENLRLPATALAADNLTLHVAGGARFERAVGSLVVGATIHEANDEAVSLSGDFTLAPNWEGERGRRMKTRVGGDVTVVGVEPRTQEKDWQAYAPYGVGAVGGVAFLGLAYVGWPHLKFGFTQVALFPLYARLRKEDVLENPLRDDILEVVDASPGISASELGRRLQCGWGTLVYHLTVLERMQLLSSAREGRHRRFFVPGRINYSDKGAASLIANPAAKNILDAVQEVPGVIQRDLGRRLGLSPGTVAWHVDRLESAGLIVKEEDGRVVRYYPSTKLIELTKQMAA